MLSNSPFMGCAGHVVVDPWTWANAIWTMDTRLAVNTSGLVSSITDRVSGTTIWAAVAANRYSYVAGPPIIAAGRSGVIYNLLYTDAGANDPARDYAIATSWTVCLRIFIRW